MKLLEQKNQETYRDLAIERDDLERILDEEREKNERDKNTSKIIISKLRKDLKKTSQAKSDLESDLKGLVEIVNQNFQVIRWKEETNSFLQIRLNELNNKYSKSLDKCLKTDSNLNQERIQHQATFRQLLDQETKNQQLENKVDEFTQRISELDLEIGKWENDYQQLTTENKEKQEKLEATEKKLTKLQLFYTRLDQEYKKNFTAAKKLEEVYHLILSDYRRIKRERLDITIAEYDKLKKEIAEKEDVVFHLTEENYDLRESLTNQQAEINNITNQKNTLQTERDNLQVELQNKDNELNSQRANFELEREEKDKEITNLKTQLQAKNIKNKELETKLENKEKEIIQELNNSLNLNISEPTLSVIITHIKELITPSPAFSDDICIRDLEIIKKIDLIDMEKFLGIQLSEKEKQQFQSTAINYQELVNFRHSFLKQNLAQISITTPSSTTDKQLSKKENVLSVLLIMSLLIIVLQFIWMKKRSKGKVVMNIK